MNRGNMICMDSDIRLAGADDVDAIAELGRITFARAYGDIVLPSDMASYLVQFFDPDLLRSEIISQAAIYFVAESRQGIAGYAKLAESPKPDQLPDERAVELIRLYVAPDSCGTGIGGRLLAAVKRKAVASGCSGLWLRVWQKNHGAIRFYEKAGFQSLGVEPYLIGITANPVVLMFAKLT